jgi:hypothetical protein
MEHVTILPLTRGYNAVVDANRADILSAKWAVLVTDGRFYGRRDITDPDTKKVRCLYLHRIVVNAPPGTEVDHINGDTLDNRACNLRIVDRATNARNVAGPKRDGTSGYLGVSWDKSRNLWTAKIQVGGKTINLGRFETKEAAHEARLESERRFGLIAPRRLHLHYLPSL